jgi:glucosyl-3-phosphoglycerate synthase
MPNAAASPPADASNVRAKARTFHHSSFPVERVAAARAERELSVAVCLPARECAATIAPIVSELDVVREAGALDRVVVVDAASADGTAELAERAGAHVWQEAELLPSFGPVLGRGDAMWRATSALDSDVVCFVDADSERFSARVVTGLIGALICEPGVSFVKGFHRRAPARARGRGGDAREQGGDVGARVERLLARPSLGLFYPQLAHIRQPLGGEVAAFRELLVALPFVTGYGIDVAMLIDAWRAVGTGAIAQVDVDVRHNRNQPLSALAPMALAVLATLARRMQREGRVSGAGAEIAARAPLERPPLAEARAGEAA